jgi:hypothetical protein
MARPLLEIWRELNRNRESEPSSLMARVIASARPKPLSVVEQAIADVGRQVSSPGFRERERLHRQFQEIDGLAERLLGKPRPVSSVQPEPAGTRKRKRKPGAGRHRVLMQEQIDRGIKLLHDSGRLSEMSSKDARRMLRRQGIDAGDTTLNDHIVKPARLQRL